MHEHAVSYFFDLSAPSGSSIRSNKAFSISRNVCQKKKSDV